MKQPIRRNIIEEGIAEPSKKQILTLVIDGNSVLKQSLVDNTVGTNGKQYGAIIQTLLVLKRMMKMRDWNFVYMVFDGDHSGQLRYDIYPEYKQNRDKNFKTQSSSKSDYDAVIDAYCKKVLDYSRKKKQLNEDGKKHKETEDEIFLNQRELIAEICDCLFIRNLICDEIEGDDIIAYIVANKDENEKICIVSNDKDLTQLIDEDVCVYIPRKKMIVTHENSVQKLGYTHENVVLCKMLCGDASDNIKGISCLRETTLFKNFPEMIKEKVELAHIFERSKQINEERIKRKQKPLKALENVLNHVTSGCQKEFIYEINERLIDLKKHPMLTESAKKYLDETIGAPLSPEGRDFKELYNIVSSNGMSKLLEDNVFGTFFSDFVKLADTEKKYLVECTQ